MEWRMHTKATEKHHGTGSLLLILALILAFSGCISENGGDEVIYGSTEATTTPDNALPEPTQGAMAVTIPVSHIMQKNISITRPENPASSYACPQSQDICMAIRALDNSAEAERINGFLRWESVRARTNISEKERLNTNIGKIDTAISTIYAGEDLILYALAGPGLPEQIRSDGIYSEEGYMSGSYDISVVWHESRTTYRDNTAYVTILVFQERKGSHILYLNESRRTIVVPRGMTWEVVSEEQVERLEFVQDSMPRYKDEQIRNIQLMYLNRIT